MNQSFEYIIVIVRVFTILPLLLVVTMYMGKRAIGQLPLFDFLVIITLASVTGADIADPSIQHIHTVIAIIIIAILQRIVSYLVIKKRWFGHIMTFEPTVVIENGVLLIKNIEHIRYSIDNILQMLREKDIFDLSIVKLAIIEANGKLTVYRFHSSTPVTLEDINVKKRTSNLAYPVMMEGKVYTEVLQNLGLSVSWLHDELTKQGITHPDKVLFASINDDHQLHVSTIDAAPKGPPFRH
ncbi:DUF421 domain-containing protein [Salipaludibacillus sp. LMS25]|uniref:DUF421 domain-containing protein n=1 Tax=Salipaludibacillus sp. LMS25 TaxID=2924031 RepID=UPI0020D13088|nr:DUF421 domain-containing protein [Salipaludibacillus sp. LMS25]UTR14583.1 DUF421 domain-containing protein [Salipaludibacillus sp. LMS25]